MKKTRIVINKKGSTLFLLFAFFILGLTIMGFAYDLCRVLYYKVYLKNLTSLTALSITHRCHYIDTEKTYFDPSDNSVTAGVVIMYSKYDNVKNIGDHSHLEKYNSQIEDIDIGWTENLADYNEHTNFTETFINNLSTAGGYENFRVVFADSFFRTLITKLDVISLDNVVISNKNNLSEQGDIGFNGKEFLIAAHENYSNLNDWEVTKNLGLDDVYRYTYSKSDLEAVYGKAAYGQDIYSKLNRFIYGKDGLNGEAQVFITGYVKLYFMNNLFYGIDKDQQQIYSMAMAQPQIYNPNLDKTITRDENAGSMNEWLNN